MFVASIYCKIFCKINVTEHGFNQNTHLSDTLFTVFLNVEVSKEHSKENRNAADPANQCRWYITIHYNRLWRKGTILR